MKFHITDDGPKKCQDTNNLCPYFKKGDKHYSTIALANAEYAHRNTDKLFASSSNSSKFLEPFSILKETQIGTKVRNLSVQLRAAQDDMQSDERILRDEDVLQILEFYRDVLQGEVPESFPDHFRGPRPNFLASMRVHGHLCEAGFYARITKETANDIAMNVGDGIVLDPMAGKGFLTKALREANVKSIATDDNSWSIPSNVEELDILESVEKYGDKVTHIALSWVPYESDLDLKVLRIVRDKYPHITIINIGEYAGCTGSEEFWAEAKEVQPEHPIRYCNVGNLTDSVTFIK